jgi:hypothetical protein
MAEVNNTTETRKSFAHAFGDSLGEFLQRTGMGQSEVARKLGFQAAEGRKWRGGARIHSYLHDDRKGRRPTPTADILYLALTKLDGFKFEYKGYTIKAEAVKREGVKTAAAAEQMQFKFKRQFNLMRKAGIIAVEVKRPSGRIEVSLSLDAQAS